MADQKDILERVSELPDDLRKALFASSTTEAIKDTGKKFGLTIDKVGELASETGRVMLGITSPSDYVKNLTSRLGVPQEKAKIIAEEINQKIFQPVRESLKKVHGLGMSLTPPATLKPPPSPLLRKEGGKETALPPYEGGREGLGVKGSVGEVKKPLPTLAEIKTPPPPPPPISKPAKPTEIPELPPIFVKNVPLPMGETAPSAPDIVPAKIEPAPKDSLSAKSALEKELNTPPIMQRPQYEKDPYREPVE